MSLRQSPQRGLTILEVMVSMMLLSLLALASGSVIRALGLLGVVQYAQGGNDQPARLRTLAMEYAQAEHEYLKNWSYDRFRDSSRCNPSAGLPTPFVNARRVPNGYLAADEPRLPNLFATADVLISSEPVISPVSVPFDCRPRRVTVLIYRHAEDAPALPGGAGGVVFLQSIAVRTLR